MPRRRSASSTPRSTRGVNFIDTADDYTKGDVRAHRRARRSRRIGARWILATKVGNVMTAKPHDGGLSRRWMLRACDDSLARLATDYIDIYYLHRDDPDTPIAETVGALGDLIRAGKIRYFGAVELPRVAHRRSRQRMRSAGRAAAGRLPAVLQPAEPDARSRDPARRAITTASASRRIRRWRAAC